jgi:hypothetical protein
MIAAFFGRLWARAWPYITAVGAAFAAVVAIRQSGKSAGRAEAKIDQLEADAKAREKAREMDDKYDSLDDDDIRRAAKRWVRGNGE